MVRKIFVVILLSMCSTMGLAQESDYISTANLKFKQIDEFILEGDINKVCELQNEILQFVDKIEDSETRFLIYDIAINKYITAKCYKEAITLSKRAVDKARDRFGPKHKEVAELLRLLGFSYAHNRQIRLAIEYGNQSVQMYEDLKEIEEENIINIKKEEKKKNKKNKKKKKDEDKEDEEDSYEDKLKKSNKKKNNKKSKGKHFQETN